MNIFEHFGAFWTKKGCKLIKNISKVMSRSTPRSQRLTTPSSSRRPMPPLSPKPLLELLGAPVVGRNSPQWIRSANQSGSFFLLPPPQQSYVGDPEKAWNRVLSILRPRDCLGIFSGTARWSRRRFSGNFWGIAISPFIKREIDYLR